MEATVGIEPTYEGFADPCLTTWLRRLGVGRRGAVRRRYGPAQEAGRVAKNGEDLKERPAREGGGRAAGEDSVLRSPVQLPLDSLGFVG